MIKDYQMFTTQDCIIGNKKNNNDELGSIFGENIVYEVPSYQREYHWKKTQLDEFWSDLKKAFNEKKMYYLGTIVGINKNDGKTIELVDGQQRLTTIMIMFFVLEELLKDKKLHEFIFLNSDSQNEKLKFKSGNGYSTDFYNIFINKKEWYKYIEKVKDIKESNSEEMMNIKEELRQNKLYMFLENGEIHISGDKKTINEMKDPKVNFYNTAYYLFYKIKEEYKTIAKIKEFEDYILQYVHFNRMLCKTQADGIEMFQVVNDRGLELSNSDLIKTYLIKKANGNNSFENDYNSIIKNIEIANITLDEFFTIFVYYQRTSNVKKGMLTEFKEIIDDKSMNYEKIMGDLKSASDRINKIAQERDRRKNLLIYLPWKMYIWAILLCEKDYNVKDETLKQINKKMLKYYYLTWMAGGNINTIKQPSFNLMSKLKNNKSGNTEDSVEKYLDSILKDVVEYKKKKEYFKDPKEIFKENNAKDIGTKAYIKPLLMMIEYSKYKKEKDVSDDIFIDISEEKVQLEHILPKKFLNNSEDWGVWNGDSSLIDSLGNLTLLIGYKNDRADKKGLYEKIKIYQEEKEPFMMTKEICDKYGKNTDKKRVNSSWDKETVTKRTRSFIKVLEEEFNTKLST